LKQNQLVYLVDSWKNFIKMKEVYDVWRKKRSQISPRRNEPNDSFRAKCLDVPKIDYKFTIDGFESQADIQADPNEW